MQDAIQNQVRSRDIRHFICSRDAIASDDRAVGDLLVRTFTESYAKKLPHLATSYDRLSELRDNATRRSQGQVLVLELGAQIIGTLAIIRPQAASTQAWIKDAANIRCVAIDMKFQGLGLTDLLLIESERAAIAWGCQYICLHVQEEAVKVAQVYCKRGYVRDENGDFITHGNRVLGYRLSLERSQSARQFHS